MQFQKIRPTQDRHQILKELKLRLEEELADHKEVIVTLGRVRGLSSEDVAYYLKQVEQSVRDVESLLRHVERLFSEDRSADLLIYQNTYGTAPSASDGYYLGTDNTELWKGTKKVLVRTEFLGKTAGSQWSSLHSQADVDEFFHLYTRI